MCVTKTKKMDLWVACAVALVVLLVAHHVGGRRLVILVCLWAILLQAAMPRVAGSPLGVALLSVAGSLAAYGLARLALRWWHERHPPAVDDNADEGDSDSDDDEGGEDGGEAEEDDSNPWERERRALDEWRAWQKASQKEWRPLLKAEEPQPPPPPPPPRGQRRAAEADEDEDGVGSTRIV